MYYDVKARKKILVSQAFPAKNHAGRRLFILFWGLARCWPCPFIFCQVHALKMMLSGLSAINIV